MIKPRPYRRRFTPCGYERSYLTLRGPCEHHSCIEPADHFEPWHMCECGAVYRTEDEKATT